MHKESDFRLCIFADGDVGYQAVRHVATNAPHHLHQVVLTANSLIRERIVQLGIEERSIITDDQVYEASSIERLQRLQLDHILLAWWPHIVKEPLISLPKRGVLNFHPSYLPHSRGKGYCFWTIVEEAPFGVTIHFVDADIDAGDIVFQKRIDTSWEDSGETLYHKARRAIIELFVESYPSIVSGEFRRMPQNHEQGSFHYASELDPASRIDLDRSYSGRELLNLLRARTFASHPACHFREGDKKFEVRVHISEVRT